MTLWFHSAILATSIAATVAVGLASATNFSGASVAEKADRLPVTVSAVDYTTIETRQDGVSILNRMPAGN